MLRKIGVALAVVAGMLVPATAHAAAPAAQPWPAYGWAQFRAEGVRIRSCASTGCPALGLGYTSHFVNWYCFESSNGFIHIHDNTTGVDGWSSDSLLWYGCG
ncbi:hypothetical protein Lfu02_03000 [Longispora fulva]|uniref:Secreted protein n=1 Tax=Longispora fulva TaxID=619741 RepID=A0A8J7G8U1_9ACTN|nr:hypothetical protein [Longispora fulva]MBG6135828.1 hypothetical protein [Longispora fulva]GIG55928.1 hypothetical protein Lfu02_03000 [Longispora fulva]